MNRQKLTLLVPSLRPFILHWSLPRSIAIAASNTTGATAAHAYKHVLLSPAIETIFVLGPSHHHSTRKCLVSPATVLATPVGNLSVNRDVCQALVATGEFEWMSAAVDTAEHSIEMQLPFLAHVLKDHGHPVKIVPIMVGNLSSAAEASYGALLAPFLHNDPTTFFVLSSDFCHYGNRFDYTPYEPSAGAVWQYIQQLDQQGLSAIATLDPAAFAAYMKQHRNTICGRHPIAVFLHVRERYSCWTSLHPILLILFLSFLSLYMFFVVVVVVVAWSSRGFHMSTTPDGSQHTTGWWPHLSPEIASLCSVESMHGSRGGQFSQLCGRRGCDIRRRMTIEFSLLNLYHASVMRFSS
jgi:AmmeMemoRadiSam system protein B